MEEKEYLSLFEAFEKAPMEEFLKTIMDAVSAEDRKRLVLEDVSFHRFNANVVTLEAWLSLEPVESDRWIGVRVEKDAAAGSIHEEFYTKDSYRKESLHSLQACIDYYRKTEKRAVIIYSFRKRSDSVLQIGIISLNALISWGIESY